MEFLSAQIRQIIEQLRTLSVSQRIAIALLVVVVLAGLWGLIQWSSQPQWVALLDQAMTPEEIQRVQSELRVAGIATRVQADRVHIQGTDEDRQRAQAMLIEHGALPRDTSLAYASLVEQNSVFIGEQRSRWLESRGLEAELSAVLRRFRGIRDARVLITVPQRRGFTRQSATSSASVALTMDDGELDKQRILAIANFVAGAVPGLDTRNVKITDGRRFYRAPDSNDAMPTEILDMQRLVEDHYMKKIYDHLRTIPGVVVNVHAKLRTSDEKMQQQEYGPPTVDSESTRSEETTGGSRAAEPAVRPNTRIGLTDAVTGSSSVKEESETSLKGQRDVKTTMVDHLRGTVERVAASVSIPRSYLEQIAQRQVGTAGGKAPAIEAIAQTELPRIKTQVRPLIDATEDDQVVVDWYYDIEDPTTAPQAAAGQDGFLALARDYGPHAGLGLLALLSLFVMARIAKKARADIGAPARAAAGAGAGGRSGAAVDDFLQTLTTGPAVMGEVEEIPGLMVAQEVDEETIRTQQLVKQIGQLVKDDSEAAAGVVRQWVSESQ